MKPPLLLLGLVLVFWGWRTEMLALGIVGAAIIELSRWVSRRTSVDEHGFRRIWNLCVALVIFAAVYLLVGTGLRGGIFTFVQWSPIYFFPLVVAQVFSGERGVPMASFFWVGRWAGKHFFDVRYPYMALCLLAAGGANRRDVWFYAGLCVFAGWALLAAGNRRSLAAGFLILALAVATGFAGHVGLHALQPLVEQRAARWLVDSDPADEEGKEARTAMGRTGELKMSSRVVMRVRGSGGARPPALLRVAAFDAFSRTVWFAGDAVFDRLVREPGRETWRLFPAAEPADAVDIFMPLSRGRALLPLPQGTALLRDLRAEDVEKSRMGTVRVESKAGFLHFSADYNAVLPTDFPPGARDLAVPDEEEPALQRVIGEAGLSSENPELSIHKLTAYFSNKYYYTLKLSGPPETARRAETPIAHFLLRSRAGHCEYFAGATVLLLRKAGIPARYAKGYLVHELDQADGSFLVRSRDAHAWALAWTGSRWIEVDATPGGWENLEREADPFYQPMFDWCSSFWFRFSEWRVERPAVFWSWASVPVLAWFFWRLLARPRKIPGGGTGRAGPELIHLGLDSELFQVEARLAAMGFRRTPADTLHRWLEELESQGRMPPGAPSLRPACWLHRRHRFDPCGLDRREREVLRREVMAWLVSVRTIGRVKHP